MKNTSIEDILWNKKQFLGFAMASKFLWRSQNFADTNLKYEKWIVGPLGPLGTIGQATGLLITFINPEICGTIYIFYKNYQHNCHHPIHQLSLKFIASNTQGILQNQYTLYPSLVFKANNSFPKLTKGHPR